MSIELKGLKGLKGLKKLADDVSLSHDLVEKIPIQFLVPSSYQPRKNIDIEMLNELAESIKVHGLIQPLLTRKINEQRYEIIAGERRWRAAEIAKITHIPVIVRQVEDNIAFAFAMLENIQRENLSVIEEAGAFARFRDEFLMTHDEIAQMIGKSRAVITNTLRLLMLDPEVKQWVEEKKLEMGHARALLTLPANEQKNVATIIIEKQLSVREAEKLVQKMKKENFTKKVKNTLYENQCEQWSQILSQKLATTVSVKMNNKGMGKAIIHFDSPKVLEWLLAYMKIE